MPDDTSVAVARNHVLCRRSSNQERKENAADYFHKAWFAVPAFLLGIGATAFYCRSILSGSVSPSASTWLVLSTAVSLSFLTYWSADEAKSLAGNIANLIDLISVWTILFCIVIRGDSIFRFNLFEIGCLTVTFAALALWIARKSLPLQSNLILQAVMMIAYFPTYHKLLNTCVNTESFEMWGITWIVSLLAFFASYTGRRNLLGIVYAGRAFVCVSIVLFLMFRLELMPGSM